jgi:hypothetical protein
VTKTKTSFFQRHGVAVYTAVFSALILVSVWRIGVSLATGHTADPWAIWPTLLAVPFGLAACQAAEVKGRRR